jgi:hypothetical protein
MQVSPQPINTQVINQALVAVVVTEVPQLQPLSVSQTSPPTQSGSPDVVRGLLPWLIALQVGVVGGLAVRAFIRRRH